MARILINSLVPIFVGLLLGFGAGLFKVVDNKDVKGLVTFLMTFALPCSLFVTIARTPHGLLWSQAKAALVLAMVYAAVYVPVYFVSRRLGRENDANSSVSALTTAFPNCAAIGFPLLPSIFGPQATVTVVIAIAIGAITITPVTLAVLENAGSKETTGSQASRIRIAVWRAFKKPVFWAPVLGLVAAVVEFRTPPYLDTSLNILAAATEGTALFVTGLIVSAQRFSVTWGVGWVVFGKNVIQPALCLAVALLLGMPLEQTRWLVLLCAIPCGFFGLLFGKPLNATPAVASSSLIASTVLGIFTLAGWIVLLSHVH